MCYRGWCGKAKVGVVEKDCAPQSSSKSPAHEKRTILYIVCCSFAAAEFAYIAASSLLPTYALFRLLPSLFLWQRQLADVVYTHVTLVSSRERERNLPLKAALSFTKCQRKSKWATIPEKNKRGVVALFTGEKELLTVIYTALGSYRTIKHTHVKHTAKVGSLTIYYIK